MGDQGASDRERLFRLYEAGAFGAVIDWYKAQPSGVADAGLTNLAGLCHARLGDHAAAAGAFRAVAGMDARFTDVQVNLALAEWKLGHLEEAEGLLRRALAQDAGLVRAWVALGRLLAERGAVEPALAALAQAVARAPEDAALLRELGLLFGRLGEAERALACLSRAAGLAPGEASVWNSLGNILRGRMETRGAEAAYRRALAIDPAQIDTLINLASLQREGGQLEAALATLRGAARQAPTHLGVALDLFGCAMALGDWSHFASAKSLADRSLEAAEQAPPFPLLALEDAPARQLLRSAKWVAAKHPRPARGAPRARARGAGRLRIGYLSADVRQHPAMQLFEGHLRAHDRTCFDVSLFSYGPPDGGGVAARVARHVETFLDLSGQPDAAILEAARAQDLDIAVDLTGHTAYSRSGLFAHRLAPLQISYLGYPGSSGAPFMDYIVADTVVLPRGHFGHYAEKVIYLPHSYQPNDNRKRIAAPEEVPRDAALPEGAFVYCCFNGTYKITPREFDIWMRCLGAVEGSCLWLLSRHPGVAANLRREAAARGVDPARLVFAPPLPPARHLARHRHADLFLDTFVINAHTTASDALWAGLPVLSRMGEQFSARVGASLLQAIGLPELIAETDAAYEALAIDLAGDPAALSALRARLARNRDTQPLFDTAGHCRTLERAYEAAIARHRAGLAPDHISL